MLKKLRHKLHLPLPRRVTSDLLHEAPPGRSALALELAHVVLVAEALLLFCVHAGGGEEGGRMGTEGDGGGDEGGGRG